MITKDNMGIKHFFYWFKNQYPGYINGLTYEQKLSSVTPIDVFMIDMNGIFHTAAQKVYEYGDYKRNKRLLCKKRKIENKDIHVYQEVCQIITRLVDIVCPRKCVVLCVDGPAPISKQNQQRQRRYVSARSKTSDDDFDSTCITPGTKFMDSLTSYIHEFIKIKVEKDANWKNIEVIFSNEKVPGEGEHKLINFIREYNQKDDIYCIHGLDADLIMLSLATHLPNFFILREDRMKNELLSVDIGSIYKQLVEDLRWKETNYKFNEEKAINDFVLLCFMTGNDFLPHIPSIEIIEDGIELMISIYKNVGTSYGHITRKLPSGVFINAKVLKIIFGTIGDFERDNFTRKATHKGKYFQDSTLEKSTIHNVNGTLSVDMNKYSHYYYRKFENDELNIEKLCHEYIQGLQWVLSYYTKGVPSWKWNFKYHYAPLASSITTYIDTYKYKSFKKGEPCRPFEQLLNVLPPQSSNLLPDGLSHLLSNDMSPFKKFTPTEFKIDLEGKRQDWEGVALLPFVDTELVNSYYMKNIKYVNEYDKKRNIFDVMNIYNKHGQNI